MKENLSVALGRKASRLSMAYSVMVTQAQKFLADLQALSDRIYPHPKIALISTGSDMEDTLVM